MGDGGFWRIWGKAAALSGLRYRPSRVSGNPAVACQDCGGIRQSRRDSRLRGKDGSGVGRTVAEPGRTVRGAGMAAKTQPPNPLILNLLKDERNAKACHPIPIRER